MPSARTSTRFVLVGSWELLSFRVKPRKLLFCLVSLIDFADSLSSSDSSDIDRILRTSVLLRMVVEQLICPPMKKQSLPFASNNGASLPVRHKTLRVVVWDKLTNIQKVPKWFSAFLVIEQQLDCLFPGLNRSSQSLRRGSVCIVPLEKAAVAGHDLGSGVASDTHESIRRIEYWIVCLTEFHSISLVSSTRDNVGCPTLDLSDRSNPPDLGICCDRWTRLWRRCWSFDT